MIVLCIPTIRSFEALDDCIRSALAGTVVPDAIFIIDNSCGKLEQPCYNNVFIHTPIYNLGCSASWNMFMKSCGDQIIISNDDVVFSETAIELFAKAFAGGAEFIASAGNNMFSCFSIRKETYAKIGEFDENFYPAYFEDNDYAMRMRIAGVVPTLLHDNLYSHIGSSTIKSYTEEEMEQHHVQFRANRQRYIDKWGGLPGEETK